MEEDLKRELERNEAATKMALAKEQEAHEAKRRFVTFLYMIDCFSLHFIIEPRRPKS